MNNTFIISVFKRQMRKDNIPKELLVQKITKFVEENDIDDVELLEYIKDNNTK